MPVRMVRVATAAAEEVDQSLGIAARWVMQRDEAVRQQARSMVQSESKTQCQSLLNAVAFSGGMFQPEGSPVAVQLPNLAGKYVHAFVTELLRKHRPIESLQVCQTYLQFAIDALRTPLPTVDRTSLVPA
ncbi:MAG: hypothetical protein R3C05_30060 [Pirellulaceae bacterium]